MSALKYNSIDEIKNEWARELEKIEPVNLPHRVLDNGINKKRIELEKKYKALILEFKKEHTN